jgi:hypothetical protein
MAALPLRRTRPCRLRAARDVFKDLQDTRCPVASGSSVISVIAELFAGTGTTAGSLFAEDYEADEPAITAKVPLIIMDADSPNSVRS